MTEQPYVVILAGGEGCRLSSLTRALYGYDLPKQFAVLAGDRSLMQTTVERAMQLTSIDRISVVVTAHHEQIARAQLFSYPGVELIVQPFNLDTAPGMLLPLARIVARSWTARVIFLPSDHYIPNPMPILQALASTQVGPLRDRISLVGVTPTAPEVEYGWITCGRRLGVASFEVAEFREKPGADIAEDLWRRGGLWNTFIQTGPVNAFWKLAHRCLPTHATALERYAVSIGGVYELAALEAAYRLMHPSSFSRDVLAYADHLAVLQVAGSGWSDWGTPARVFASLVGTAAYERIVERIRGDLALAG
ncbi:MAG: NTP transferase domain-containing protein [Kofleriaceae bacterium]|nr:NTP transferase domain-containing protein [Kofleriaceae bacterium]